MKRLIALVLALAGVVTAGSAFAWGYGPRVSLGFHYGYWGPGPYWGSPWYPAYYYPPYPPTVIVTTPPAPVQYIERPAQPAAAPAPVAASGPFAPVPPQATPAPAPQAQTAGMTPGYWYFCENPRGYYPHVPECPVPWKAVPPVPPPAQ